ncbi:helix-turn-helix domain-containing protein [Pseudomonas lundensis]
MKQDELNPSLSRNNDYATCIPKTTAREQQILQCCAKGMTSAEIAKVMHRSVSTINFHFLTYEQSSEPTPATRQY